MLCVLTLWSGLLLLARGRVLSWAETTGATWSQQFFCSCVQPKVTSATLISLRRQAERRCPFCCKRGEEQRHFSRLHSQERLMGAGGWMGMHWPTLLMLDVTHLEQIHLPQRRDYPSWSQMLVLGHFSCLLGTRLLQNSPQIVHTDLTPTPSRQKQEGNKRHKGRAIHGLGRAWKGWFAVHTCFQSFPYCLRENSKN